MHLGTQGQLAAPRLIGAANFVVADEPAALDEVSADGFATFDEGFADEPAALDEDCADGPAVSNEGDFAPAVLELGEDPASALAA